jgi:hypothetical protein
MLEYIYGGALGVGFVLASFWWQHRSLSPLDPSADGSYDSAYAGTADDVPSFGIEL